MQRGPASWVSVGGDMPNYFCKPWHNTLLILSACFIPLCLPGTSTAVQRNDEALQLHLMGTEESNVKANRFRPRQAHGRGRHYEVKRLAGLEMGAKSTCFASYLLMTQKISICHTTPGTGATRVLAAFLHASVNRSHLCAKATFEDNR